MMAAQRFHLRRVGPSANDVQHQNLAIISLDKDMVKFGRNPDQVEIILNSRFYSNMISREHAEMRRVRRQDGSLAYLIIDKSLNGTYINENRAAKEAMELHVGDTIKFGHVNGAAIQPGQHAPQPQAEFTYIMKELQQLAAMEKQLGVRQMLQSYAQLFEKVPAAGSSTATTIASSLASLPPSTPWSYNNPYTSGLAQQPVQPRAVANTAAQRYAAPMANYGAQTAAQFNPYNTALFGPSAAQQAYAAFYANHYGTPSDVARPPGNMAAWTAQQQQAAIASCALQTQQAQQPTAVALALRLQQQQQVQQAQQQQQVQQAQQQHSLSTNTATSTAAASVIQVNAAAATAAVVQQVQLPPMKGAGTSAVIDANIKKMECDSSVPSPPHNNNSTTDSLSQDLRLLAAQASAHASRTNYNTSPTDFLAGGDTNKNTIEPETGPHEEKSSTSTTFSANSPTPRRGSKDCKRKSNELGRLLNDLTDGIFMKEVTRRKPSTPLSADEKPVAKRGRKPKAEEEGEGSDTSSIDPGTDCKPVIMSESEQEKEKSAPLKKRKGVRAAESQSPAPLSVVKKEASIASALGGRGRKKEFTKKASKSPKKRRGVVEHTSLEDLLEEPLPVVIEDPWKFHDSEQCCAAGLRCSKPQDSNIQWVCCEACDTWYHVACGTCTEEEAADEHFEYNCGCNSDDDDDDSDAGGKTKKKKKVVVKKPTGRPRGRKKAAKEVVVNSDDEEDDEEDEEETPKKVGKKRPKKTASSSKSLSSVGKRNAPTTNVKVVV